MIDSDQTELAQIIFGIMMKREFKGEKEDHSRYDECMKIAVGLEEYIEGLLATEYHNGRRDGDWYSS